MYLKPGNTVRGGGTQFPRELSPVNWFCTTRELGPGDHIPLGSWVRGGPYSLREYGPPDRKLGRTVYPMTPARVCSDSILRTGAALLEKRYDM